MLIIESANARRKFGTVVVKVAEGADAGPAAQIRGPEGAP